MIEYEALNPDMPYPYNRTPQEYDALEHYSVEDRPHPDDDRIPPLSPRVPGAATNSRHFFSTIGNFDAVAGNNFSGIGPKGYQRSESSRGLLCGGAH